MELLLAQLPPPALEAAGSGAAPGAAPVPLSAALLLPVLRLLCETRHEEVRQLARRWVLTRLGATGALGRRREEALVWLDLLPR